MSELINAYKEYYREQNIKSAEYLWKSILNYDFQNYEYDMKKIFNMKLYAKTSNSGVLLSTSGSTNGIPKQYIFAPNFGFWHNKIETFLRAKDKFVTVMLKQFPHMDDYNTNKYILYKKSSQKNYSFNCDWANREKLCVFFDFLNELYGQKGLINLMALPYMWVKLNTNFYFKEKILKIRDKIYAFVNSDCDACYKKIEEIYLRDQMIDWASGLNFYICQNKNRHFLPIFFILGDQIYNLLNLNKINIKTDDNIYLEKKIELCSCGKLFLKNDMIFHKGNKLVDSKNNIINISELYESLNSHFINLQFYQNLNNNVVCIYKIHKYLDNDLKKIENFFSLKDINLSFKENIYFSLGQTQKRPCTWRASQVEYRSIRC